VLKTSDFDYDLPQELIAQSPADRRDSSRLMVLDRISGRIEHKIFSGIKEHIGPDDLIVMNNTKVIPARLHGTKYGGSASIEVLLDKMVGDRLWEALIRPAKRMDIGGIIEFGKGFYAEVRKKLDDGKAVLYFASVKGFANELALHGNVPLPPYIKADSSQLAAFSKRYQTVYAEKEGATAAPTAGLHFTKELLDDIKAKKIYVTLHTGYGTFAPVRAENVADHKMHSEAYEISEESLDSIRQAKKNGGRVIAVGTTSARLLESVCCPGSGSTDIFIYPGYEFKVVDAMITNFHLPKSTLLMLVSAFAQMAASDRSAFAGIDLIKKAYKEAVKEKYRFFSFGDAMLIL
jgi:S-adenosylmethionine:tRNA ribosyltransferase-isomerase